MHGVPTTACRTYSAAVLQEMDTALATWAVKHAVDGTVHVSSVEQKCSYVEEVSEASLCAIGLLYLRAYMHRRGAILRSR